MARIERESALDRAGTTAQILSPEERRARGKALREAVPRQAQGVWEPPVDRHDPIDLLAESNAGRLQQLVWYDKIDFECFVAEITDDEDKRAVIEKHAQARKRSLPEVLFPKLAERRGTTPRIMDDPPLILHPTEDQAPGIEIDYQRQIARYRESLPEHVRVLFDRQQKAASRVRLPIMKSSRTMVEISREGAMAQDWLLGSAEDVAARIPDGLRSPSAPMARACRWRRRAH